MFDFMNNDDYSTGYSPAEESIVESLYNLVLGKQKPSGAPGLDSQTLRMSETPYQQQTQARPNYFQGYQENMYGTKPVAKPGSTFGTGLSYMDTVRNRESTNNYKAINTKGFLGGYQFGAQALQTAGLVKKGVNSNKALNNPDNWNIPGGKEAFLNNPQVQDMAMKRFTENNKNVLTRMGVITKSMTPQQVNAILMVAHLLGPGGARDFLKGKNKKDAYGTSAQDYYNLGLKTSS